MLFFDCQNHCPQFLIKTTNFLKAFLFLTVILLNSCTPKVLSQNSAPTAIPTDLSSLEGIGNTKVSPKDNATMVYVPAGEFLMGSKVGLTDEQPVHRVYLDAYWVDRTEVTNAIYANCVKSGACRKPGSLVFYNDPAYSNHPVEHVSWRDAVNYCSWAGRRLLTEAEWEKVAIWDPYHNQQRIYPWGNTYDCKKGNYDDETDMDASLMADGSVNCDGYAYSAPVGSYPQGASIYGVLDLGGNVWEWVHDAFLEADPFNATIKNYYAISPEKNPQGVDPKITDYRVARGGSYNSTYGFGRSAYRLWFGLDDAYDGIGVRCGNSQ